MHPLAKFTAGSLRGRVSAVRKVLPRGQTLPTEMWVLRHRWLRRLLWAHVPAVLALGLAVGASVGHSLVETSVIVVFAALASAISMKSRRAGASAVVLGLLSSSAILTHLSGGYIEAHFHFFVIVTLLVLYEDWAMFSLAIGYVLVHHGIGSALMAEAVFNHPGGVENPWKWAMIHAGAIAALSVSSIIAWRINENSRAGAWAAHRETDEALEVARVNEARFRGSFDHAPIGMALVGLAGNFLKVNAALCALTGYSTAELLGRTFQEITHPDDLEADLQHAEELAAGVVPAYDMEKRYITASGGERWVLLSGSVVRDGHGQPMHFIAQVLDIDARKRAEAELRHLADSDPLTGLSNRRYFEGRLATEITRCRRMESEALLLMIDLDGFKEINDTLGHSAGDEALRQVASSLAGCVREGDVVARLGGDEFAVLMDGVTSSEAAAQSMSVLDAIKDRPLHINGQRVAISPSIGLWHLDSSCGSAEEALGQADLAMYATKLASRAEPGMFPLKGARARSSSSGKVRHDRRDGRHSVAEEMSKLLSRVVAEREPTLHEHSSDVVSLALRAARSLGCSGEDLDIIARAAEQHDVGKLAIPDAILLKPGPLNQSEWDLVRQHTIVGERILAGTPALRPVARVVRSCHEHWDGTGYPDGLIGDKIPLAARIVGISDAYSAMISDRPYRQAMSIPAVIDELRLRAGTQFDPDIVEPFISSLVTRHRAPPPGPAQPPRDRKQTAAFG